MQTTIHSRAHARETGSALVASLVVVTLVAGLGAGLIHVQSALTRRHVQSVDKKRALYVAEAGIAEAFNAIAIGKSGQVASENEPALFGGGVYWVEASEDNAGRVTLDATGLCGTGRFALSVVVLRDANPAALNGVFGQKEVTVGAGALIDGYDSRRGSFDEQLDSELSGDTTGDGAKLSSNGDVLVEGNLYGPPIAAETLIYGDARPGPNGAISTDPGVLISGSTSPIPYPVRLPPVSIPDLGESLGAVTVPLGLPVTMGNEEILYDQLTVSGGGILTLEGPLTLVVTDLLVLDNGRLVFDTTNGPVLVYVTEKLILRTGSVLANPSEDPTQVGLLVGDVDEVREQIREMREAEENGEQYLPPPRGDPKVVLRANGVFYGLIYAPFNEIVVPNGLRVYGAVAADAVTLQEDARLSYDGALATATVGIEALPQILSWRIKDLPDTPLVKMRVDPLAAMKVLGITAKESYKSHKESQAIIRYVDSGGTPQTYTGDVNVMNWTNVKYVVDVQWEDPVTTVWTAPKVPPGSYSGAGYTNQDPLQLLLF